MLVSNTYPTLMKRDLPRRYIPGQPDAVAIASFFHAAYLSIFTPQSPAYLLSWAHDQKTAYLSDLRSRGLQQGAPYAFSSLMTLVMKGDLLSDPIMAHVAAVVMLCYANDFPANFDDLQIIPFDEAGSIYAPIAEVNQQAAISAQGAGNLLRMAPLHRWMAAFALPIKDDVVAIDRMLRVIYPIVATPVVPEMGDLTRTPSPLTNMFSRMMILDTIGGNELTQYRYDQIRLNAWKRFISFGFSRVQIADTQSAADLLSLLMMEVTHDSPFRTMIDRAVALNKTTMMVSGILYSDSVVSADSQPNRISLEALQLITDSDTVGDGSSSDGDTDGDNSGDGSDPATDPVSSSPADQDAQTNGNNPSGFVMGNNTNQVNNNSIGEEVPANPFGAEFVPQSDDGKTPDQVAGEYHYLMAVATLNSRLSNESGADVSPEVKAALAAWCRYDMWLYPTSLTRELMVRLGLQKILTPFK